VPEAVLTTEQVAGEFKVHILSYFSSILTQFDILEHSIYAHISDTPHVVRTRP
jgi:hypothetical protein